MTSPPGVARAKRPLLWRALIRAAIYFTPPADHALTLAAAAWLGRDAFGRDVPPIPGTRARQTVSARRYGFHATLKAPFRLAESKGLEDLDARFDKFAATFAPVTIDRVVLEQIDGFFALVPADNSIELETLANCVVRDFERFRAPLTEAEIARRRPEQLSPAQRLNLERFGYPYVGDEFRFHMTLTDSLPKEESSAVRDELDAHFAPFLGRPLHLDHLAIFVEEEPGGSFSVRRLAALDSMSS